MPEYLNSDVNIIKNFNPEQRVFFAKTAQNFYNMAKGYWRPKSKERKLKLKNQIEKSINILQAYGEYDNFKDF
jgi:hypothetical protein